MNDWHRKQRPETSLDILRRALTICPHLAPPSACLSGRDPTPDDLLPLVEAELVGFRPSRSSLSSGSDSGLRLEKGQPLKLKDAETDIIYNYGHGGFGWQSCWGCAEEVVQLIGSHDTKKVGPAFRKAAGLLS